MRFARGLLIFSYGLFTIGAQTLLFREFVTAFEGNDLGIGVFFGAWLLWIALGALFVRRWGHLADRLLAHVESLLLLYLPAALGQFWLILHVRELAGVASYDLMSVPTLVLWALVVNAPVSLVTGMLFPLACAWIEQAEAFPIARVYLLEAAGSFAGGLGVTALLAAHVPAVRVFLLLAFALLASVGVAGLGAWRKVGYSVLALAMLTAVGLAARADEPIIRRLQASKWSRLLPQDGFAGAFTTAQAEYLYGRYRDQWVVLREGSVCEALPNEEEAGRTVALALCQNPQARHILVIGSGLALCRRLLLLPQVQEVAWAGADGEYAQWLPRHLPEEFSVADSRLCPVAGEIREYLAARPDHFDLIIVNLPDVANSTFNRYFTVEFYQEIKAALGDGGVVSVSIAGHENIMGAELVGLGASAKETLAQVFANLVLVPGDQTWLLASDSDGLTGEPAVLQDRFAALAGAPQVFPPAGLSSIYQPDRAAEALRSYEKTELPENLLVNRDARPLTHLYGLLLAARQSGASLTRVVKLLAVAGWLPFAVPILIFVALRLWAGRDRASGQRASSFDSSFLVFSTGWVGMATILLLMYAYETRFGSLYLHIGVISSLFMAGLTAGSVFITRILHIHSTGVLPASSMGILPVTGGNISGHDARGIHGRDAHATEGPVQPADIRLHILLLGTLSAHGLLLAALVFWLIGAGSARWLGQGTFAAAFVLSGLCCGGYWPLAAGRLADDGFQSGEAGSRLEAADHFGACLGGLATSLLMVPVLGTRLSLLVLIGLLAANLPAALTGYGIGSDPRGSTSLQTAWAQVHRGDAGLDSQTRCIAFWGPLRRAGYVLFGLVASIVLCSNLLARAAADLQLALPDFAIQALAGERRAQPASVALRDSGKCATYFTLTDAEQKPAGYLFSSTDFAPEVRGFGGRLNLAIHVDASGRLIDLVLVRSNETPSYLDLLRDWLGSLKGRPLFAPASLSGVQAVTGATISSQAVLDALQTSGRRFAAQVLGSPAPVPTGLRSESWARYLPDPMGLYLVGALAAAFAVTHWGGTRSRMAVLVLTFILGGIVLNAQYSSEQIATLLSFETPAAKLTGVFLLAVGVPLVVFLFGNLYCGYICPFGAAQELLGHLVPHGLRPAPRRHEMQVARVIKYAVLAVLVVTFFLARDRRTLAGDPLTSAFTLRSALATWPTWTFGAVGAALVGSLFYERFWCRYLCPVGAFLSLLHHARPLRHWLPARRFGNCEFGLTASDHLDCLYCDRCRYPAVAKPALPPPPPNADVPKGRAQWWGALAIRTYPLVLATVLCGLFVAGVSLRQFRRIMPSLLEEPVATATAGQPRDVDVQRIRTLIEQHQLSDRKAEYYQRLDASP